MAKNTVIDSYTARRLLTTLALENEASQTEIDWALEIIHQIPGYEKIELIKAAQDSALKETLSLIAREEIAPTAPQDLEKLITDAEVREKALKESKAVGEKQTEEFIKSAQKVPESGIPKEIPPAAPEIVESSFDKGLLKISPDTFRQLSGWSTHTPLQLIAFFSPPKKLLESPETAAALSEAVSLNQLEKKIGTLTSQQKELLKILRQIEINISAQTRLLRIAVPIDRMTLSIEHGAPQSQLNLIFHTSEGGPSLIGGIAKSIAGNVIQKTVSKIATKAIASALTKAGVSLAVSAAAGTGAAATGAAAGAAAGGPLAPITAIIGAVVGWVAAQIPNLISFFNKHAGEILIGGGALIFGSAFLLPESLASLVPVFKIGGSLSFFTGATIRTGGPGPALSNIGKFFNSLVAGLKSIAVESFIVPVIISLMAVPAVIAIILFIINSGAYIVPPPISLLAGGLISPYVDVKKIISPDGDFKNDQLPLTVEYTITIKAKKGTLSNIKFEDKCQVIKKGSPPDCPSPDNPIEQPDNSFTLSSGDENYEIKYKRVFSKPIFEDTLTIDTFTVTFDVPEQNGAQGVASAAVKIGNPPEDCPSNSWPIANDGGLNYVTQGPHAPGCSHRSLEAIDIGLDGAQVLATHGGVASVVQNDPCYGNYIDIQSTCGSTVFVSRYAHLGVISISNGRVNMGQTIGISDNTHTISSCSTGPHLHFDFRAPGGGAVSIPIMRTPYLKRDIPVGCCSIPVCN